MAPPNDPLRYEMVVFWSEEDRSYLVEVPELPGCMADGGTYREAVENAETVMAMWIETAREEGWEIPEPGVRRTDPVGAEATAAPLPVEEGEVWSYRVVERVFGERPQYAIHEAIRESEGKIMATEHPVGVIADTLQGLAVEIDWMSRALKAPMLRFVDARPDPSAESAPQPIRDAYEVVGAGVDDPVTRSLAKAPAEDEPVSDDEDAAV